MNQSHSKSTLYPASTLLDERPAKPTAVCEGKARQINKACRSQKIKNIEQVYSIKKSIAPTSGMRSVRWHFICISKSCCCIVLAFSLGSGGTELPAPISVHQLLLQSWILSGNKIESWENSWEQWETVLGTVGNLTNNWMLCEPMSSSVWVHISHITLSRFCSNCLIHLILSMCSTSSLSV